MADADRVHIGWEEFVYTIGADCYAPAGTSTDIDLCRDRVLQGSARLLTQAVSRSFGYRNQANNTQSQSWLCDFDSTYTRRRRFMDGSWRTLK